MFPFGKSPNRPKKNRRVLALRSMNAVDLADAGLKPSEVEQLVEQLRVLDQ